MSGGPVAGVTPLARPGNIQSDQRQRSEMPYYSAVLWLYHLQSSLFISFHASNSNEIITQCSLPTRLVNFSEVMEKS
jgi:hypothetical protein